MDIVVGLGKIKCSRPLTIMEKEIDELLNPVKHQKLVRDEKPEKLEEKKEKRQSKKKGI